MTLLCITTTRIPGIRPCTHRDQHIDSCDGWAYVWNTERSREEATGRECTGCLPREARVGLLCWGCWNRLEAAYAEWDRFAAVVEGIDRAVQGDNGGIRGSSAGHVNLAQTTLHLDACRSYLRSRAGTLESWVSTEPGARDAVQFTAAAQAAYRSLPIEMRPVKLRRVFCPSCRLPSLVREPPAGFAQDEVVVCQTAGCGKRITDQRSVVTIAEIERRVG